MIIKRNFKKSGSIKMAVSRPAKFFALKRDDVIFSQLQKFDLNDRYFLRLNIVLKYGKVYINNTRIF